MQFFQNFLWFSCLTTHLLIAECSINLQITLHSYRNPTSSDCGGSSCDPIFTTCENQFTFCLRSSSASSCTFGSVTSGEIEDDDFTFSPSTVAQLGLSNPLSFQNFVPTEGIVLQINIIDTDDFNSDDHVDTININIPIPTDVNIGSTSISRQSYTGICGRATIQLSYRVSCSRSNFSFPDCTECLPDYYGINCDTRCVPRNDADGHYTCNPTDGSRTCIQHYAGLPDCLRCEPNYFGDSCSVYCVPPTATHICNASGVPVCKRGFAPPNCTECLPDYYSMNSSCDTFCIPHNNASGHYTCNQTDGSRMCIQYYAGLPDCLSCAPNYFGDNCSVPCFPHSTRHICDNLGRIVCRVSRFALPDCASCLPNFQGLNCESCILNYYPPGDCNVHCTPQDNSSGHFTCDPLSGDILCLSGFTDPQSNCTIELPTEPTPSPFTTPTAIGAYVGAGLGVLLLCCCAWCCCCMCIKWDPKEDRAKFTRSNWRECQKHCICCCCTCQDCKDCVKACIGCPAACVKGLAECATGCCKACVECPAACVKGLAECAKGCCQACIECPAACAKACCKACIECPAECVKGCFKLC